MRPAIRVWSGRRQARTVKRMTFPQITVSERGDHVHVRLSGHPAVSASSPAPFAYADHAADGTVVAVSASGPAVQRVLAAVRDSPGADELAAALTSPAST